MDRIKVVWLCHLTNSVLNKHFNMDVDICAYWMTQFLDIIKNESLDLHVVAPNYYRAKDESFTLGSTHFHLYKCYSKFGNSKTALVECALWNNRLQNKIARVISGINPDVIHLFGAENVTYSQGVIPFLGLNNVVLTLQGYIQLAEKQGGFLRQFSIAKRVKNEDIILKGIKHVTFADIEDSSRNFYLRHYGGGKCHILNFPIKKTKINAASVEKKYDVVFWGRVTVDKGVEDLIHAISILKKKRPNISCLILGGGAASYFEYLNTEIRRLDVMDNIEIAGFQKTNEDLFSKASKARVYVLPTHFDAMPGSIRESMQMKLPVISYPVGDIPILNKDRYSVMLAEYRNVRDLSICIEKLLSDNVLYNDLMNNAYKTVSEAVSEETIRQQFLDLYNNIVLNKL